MDYYEKNAITLSLVFSYFSYGQQVQKSLTAANGSKIGFYQYTPVDYDPSVKYPLIIFLHGAGEVGNGGSDLYKVLNNGIPRLINGGADMKFTVNGETSTFLVLSPQLDSRYGNWQDFYADEMLKYARANLSMDENRIYLTGLSLGGGGTWSYISSDSNHTSQFAAISPIAGTGETHQYFCWVAYDKVACWAFHDMDDPTVPVGNTQYAEMTLNNCDPNHTEVRQFTYYPSGGHNAWDRAYDMGHSVQNPNLYEFFLMNPRTGVEPTTPIADAGVNQYLNYPTTSTTLDGSKSYDQDGGSIVSYLWSDVEGARLGTIVSPGSAVTQVTNLTKGVHGYILTVTDNNGETSSDVMLVDVKGDPAENMPPVADAGADTTIRQPQDTVVVNGINSFDPDGLIAAYRWKMISGPAPATIVDTGRQKTAIRDLQAGTYMFSLTCFDVYNTFDTDTIKVIVEPPPANNKPPVANAGNDFSTKDNFAYLSGGASYDPDGKVVGFQWMQVSGPGTATIISGNTMFPTVQSLVPGTYMFQLTASDNYGATDQDTVALTVLGDNDLPIANAGPDQNLVSPATTAMLDGSSSSDPDGTIVSYAWRKVSGPAGGDIDDSTSASITISNLVLGTYVYELKVTDDMGGTATDQVAVTLGTANNNKPPVANAGNDFSTKDNFAYLSAGASYDPDGKITAFNWTQTSGPNTAGFLSGNTMFPTVNGLVPGTYVFKVMVTDDDGGTAADEVTLVVEANQPPVLDLPDSLIVTLPITNVHLNASRSFDPDGTIRFFTWELVGSTGPIIGTPNMSSTAVSNLTLGLHFVKLTAIDNRGGMASKTIKIIVSTNKPPVAKAGFEFVSANNYVYLSGAGSYDLDGSIVSYKWTQAAGPAGATIWFDNTMFPTVVNLTPGLYVFNLVVTDNGGFSSSDYVKVVVIPRTTETVNKNNILITTVKPDESALKGSLSLYPNPAISTLKLALNNKYTGKLRVTIVDAMGKTQMVANYTKPAADFQQQLDVSKLRQGVYYMQIFVDGQSGGMVKKFIKL